MPSAPKLIVDRTHLGRRASGIERITEELFSDCALRPLPVEGFAARGRGKLAVAVAQMARAPLAMALRPSTVWIFSGFPPSPPTTLFRDRAVMYVHDMFLMTREQDLNRTAKLYMAAPFRVAIKRLRYFLVNSATTGAELAPHIGPDAEIKLYRPAVRNVFGLSSQTDPNPSGRPFVLGAIGTVEPRKNFTAAAAIALALGRKLGRPVELHIVGRPGWGDDYAKLARLPHVRLHGFLSDAEARVAIARFDALICTSHDEGLGLPLIETQYAGLQTIAPDKPIFREVLAASGLFIRPEQPEGSAESIAALVSQPDWRRHAQCSAGNNVRRWNDLAESDRPLILDFLAARLARLSRPVESS